jgi:hypothetical protein
MKFFPEDRERGTRTDRRTLVVPPAMLARADELIE